MARDERRERGRGGGERERREGGRREEGRREERVAAVLFPCKSFASRLSAAASLFCPMTSHLQGQKNDSSREMYQVAHEPDGNRGGRNA